MSVAVDLLRQVEAAGGSVEARGEKLTLRAPQPLPDLLMDSLRQHKSEVLSFVRTKEADWLTEFEERAAILEYEQGLPRSDAEERAYETLLVRWLNSNPPERADRDRCAACGGWLIGDFVPLALRDKTGRPVWVHSGGVHGDGCLRTFWKKRRAEAERALDAAGVRRPKREKA